MAKDNNRFQLFGAGICLMLLLAGCNAKMEENQVTAKPAVGQAAAAPPQAATDIPLPLATPVAATTKKVPATAAVVEVNGSKFTRAQFDGEMKKKLNSLQERMPAERLQQLQPELKKQVIDDFVVRTLLSQEVKRLKITATEGEVKEHIDRVKSSLPPGANFEDLLKKNELTPEKFREEITLGVKVDKLVKTQPLAKNKPSEKEITKYYQDNKDKFKSPETVHARHLLISKNAGDDEKVKAEKKLKVEALRKQLLEGADFAELAAKNSDCPSKSNGGDLGTFPRGQMVKPFEDAAFTQKLQAIGPIVETDFGYHIIQVLERSDAKVITLDKKIKEEIGLFLQQQKRQDAFTDLVKKLKAKATIIVAGQ